MQGLKVGEMKAKKKKQSSQSPLEASGSAYVAKPRLALCASHCHIRTDVLLMEGYSWDT